MKKPFKMYPITKHLIFLAILLSSFISQAQTVSYHLSEIKERGGKNFIRIEMTFTADASGVTKLLLPDQWTDATQLFENIININLKNPKTQQTWLIDGSAPSEKYVISQPSTNIKLTYELTNNSQHNFKPHITKKYFSFIGKTAFIVPIFHSNDESNEMMLQWSTPTDRKSYHVVNSYGLEQLGQKISAEELMEGVFLGGELYISILGDEKNKIIFAYNDKQRSEPQLKWEKDTAALISAQRLAMKDNNNPYYLVSMIKYNELDRPFSATHLKNSVLFVCGEQWFILPREELIRYTTHELFHHWIGQKIKASNDYLSAMWFFEGFNDFLSIELAFQAGFLTEQAYIDIKNRVLRAHYRSPFQSIPNREVALYYWDNPELHSLPYIKGHLFAQFCNHILKEQNRSLFDVISLLVQPSGPYYKERFTETDLINALAKLISTDIYEAYVKYFIQCEHFSDHMDLNLKGYPLKFIHDNLPKYDIDLVGTFLENRIVGLSTESEPYQVGLREGWPITHIEIDPLLKRETIKIHVFNNANELQTVVLNPHYHKIKMPIFKKCSNYPS